MTFADASSALTTLELFNLTYTGWVIVTQVVSYLDLNTIWVLPLFFTWWLPFVVAGIYDETFMIGWNSMKKINPIKTVNEID